MDLRALDVLAWDAAKHVGPCQQGMKDHAKRIPHTFVLSTISQLSTKSSPT